MKRLTVIGALAMLCVPSMAFAQTSGVLQGVERLACEAILCLSSSLQPGPCKPSLSHYFDIRKYRKGSFSWSRTVDARQAFLNQCPVSSSPDMDDRIKAISKGAGRCDADYLNSTYKSVLYRFKVRRDPLGQVYYDDITTVPTVTKTDLPAYCVTYNDHAWTYDLSIKYVGNPLRGGYWVKARDYDAQLAKWEAEYTGDWADQWQYSLRHPNEQAMSVGYGD